MSIPRPEHPRPQFVRERWLNLNGEWEFAIDAGDTGFERGLVGKPLDGRITVPFCPESALSGVGNTDRMLAVWYRRQVAVPAAWAGQQVLLHFQAVDYDATVWVDGVEVARHRGGFTPFSAELGDCGGRTVTITVRARDDWRGFQPRGKQVPVSANCGCHYTRTTGIWQTVWLEAVPACAMQRPRITPDVAQSAFQLVVPLRRTHAGLRLHAVLTDAAGPVVASDTAADRDFAPALTLTIPKNRVRLWSLDDPHLYGLTVELRDAAGALIDRLVSYAGLRAITFSGKAVLINGTPVFQRLVLDQGYWPDGIMTAPSDAALVADIELSKQAGFNGARLHQKVFEERFLHHADRLGYLCWGEFADWSWGTEAPADPQDFSPTYITQWIEAVTRDFSHPSIIGWCGLNETNAFLDHDRTSRHDDAMRGIFLAAKAIDPTRPVLDVSGWCHRVRESDIYDSHDYEQDPAKFAERHAGSRSGKPLVSEWGKERRNIPYGGQPYFVSEFGGIWWNPDAKPGEDSWGYGQRPTSLEEFHTRFAGLCAVLLDDPSMFGYCYTQLTDVYQEQNGIFRFDRRPKFDLARIRAAQQRPAAIEQTQTGEDRHLARHGTSA